MGFFNWLFGRKRHLEPKLFEAVKIGKLENVKQLINKGVNPNVIEDGDYTPLCWAARLGYIYIIEFLIDHGAKPNFASGTDSLPLIDAIVWEKLDAAKVLVKKGADVNRKFALHTAARKEDPRYVQLLLDNGADPRLTTKEGKTALDVAREERNDKVIRLLEQAQ